MINMFLRSIVLLLLFTASISAVLARRSEDSTVGYHCLQLRNDNRTRHLIDTRSGERANLRTDLYKVQPLVTSPVQSPDGAITAYITESARATNPDNSAVLWLEGAGVSSAALLSVPANVDFMRWVADRVLLFSTSSRQSIIAGSITINADGTITPAIRRIPPAKVTMLRLTNRHLYLNVGASILIWSPDLRDWLDVPLPAWAHDQLGIAPDQVPPENENGFPIRYELATEQAYIIVDVQRGYRGTLHYLPDEFVFTLRWSPTGRYLAALVSRNEERRIDVWDLAAAQPVRIDRITVASMVYMEWLWAADERSAIYSTMAEGGSLHIRRRQLDAASGAHRDPDLDPLLLAGQAGTLPLLIEGKLLFNLRQVNGAVSSQDTMVIRPDGTIGTLARTIPTDPFVSLSQLAGFLGYHWSDGTRAHFLLVDVANERTIDLLADVTDIVRAGFQFLSFGDVLIAKANIPDGASNTTRYFAINRRTFQTFPLIEAGQRITVFSPGSKAGTFAVQWVSDDVHGLHVFSDDGRRLSSFHFSSGDTQLLNFSPDAQNLLFIDAAALQTPSLLHADGSTRQLPVSAAVSGVPVWSPDSTQFVAMVDNNLPGADDLIVLDAGGDIRARFPYSANIPPTLWTRCR